MFYILVFPFVEIACIFFYRDRLDDPKVAGNIGKMWAGVDGKKGKWAMVYR